jgi:DNA-3-methyladenine glycosylase
MKLKSSFYLRNDVVQISKDLLGKFLFTNVNNNLTAGIITETEAYIGITDRASHSFGNRRTNRTEIMYAKGGTSYVYICYGIHHLFNVVTNEKDIPDAVLIRAIHPVIGIDIMKHRRNKTLVDKAFSNGPGTAATALGIDITLNGINLIDDKIWIEDQGIIIPEKDITIGPRVGVESAGKDALLPYRFQVLNKELFPSNK